MHRIWAARRAWRVRLGIAIGLALLLFPLALWAHPAWLLASLLGLLYPWRWEESRALAELDRRYGLAYRSALEAPAHHPWRSQLQTEAEASLQGARLPAFPWAAAALYLALVGMVWVLPPLHLPFALSPVVAPTPSSPATPASPQNDSPTNSAQPSPSPQPGQTLSPEDSPQSQQDPEAVNPSERPVDLRSQKAEDRADEAAGQEETQGAARSGSTGESPQGREQPVSSQNDQGSIPAQNTPTGQPQPDQTGQPQTGQPGQNPPTSQPGQAQPSQPGQAQPSQTGRSPSEQTPQGQSAPGSQGRELNPSAQPSQQPEPARLPQPGSAQPGQAQSGSQSGQTQASRDNQGQSAQGQPGTREEGGAGVQGRPARPLQAPPGSAQRPAGEAPFGRGEGRQGRPMPLPSPWQAGPPPENVQRQAEKYLESEPLPPEVREVVRRYFELPQR